MWLTLKRLALGVALIVLVSSVLLASDWGRRRSSADRVRHLAILQHASTPTLDSGVEGMIAGLAQAGFVEGSSIAIRRYNAENDMATANAIAKQITTGDYDLVLTASTISMQAVANANRAGTTMHVFGLVSDPFSAGVGLSRAEPLRHPRHLVGYGTMQPVAEAFALARRLRPGLETVGTVWNPSETNSQAQLALARATCERLGIRLLEAAVDATSAVGEAANSLVGRDVQAIWIPGDVTVLTAVDAVVSAARKGRIPVFTSIPGNTERGALFDLGADYHEVGRLAGELAAKIMGGADSATIAVTNVLPQTLRLNPGALQGLKERWQVPDDVQRLAAAKAPAATPLARKWKVDLLEFVNVPDVEEAEAGMRTGLRDAGLVEGQDYEFSVRNAQGDMATLSTMVDAALSSGADLLLTTSTPTLQAALRRAGTVPVVFTFVADAVAAGAGRTNEDHLPNVTGVPSFAAHDEMIDLVRECLPGARRIGTLFVPGEVNSVYTKEHLEAAAARQGLELVAVAVNTSTDVPDATLALLAQRVDALCQGGSNLTAAAFASITRPAQRARVPVFGFLSGDLGNGAAVVLARDYFDGGREAALLAARVMRGERPAAIPFQPLRVLKVLVNLEAARAVGLTVPAPVVARASKVIGG